MKTKFLFILAIMFCFQGFSQTEAESKKYRLLTYGMVRSIDQVQFAVNQKWNIEKVSVAGCRVNSKLKDSVGIHNKMTWDLIGKEKGIKNPELEYQKQLYKTRRALNKIQSLVQSDSLTISIWKNLMKKENDFLVYKDLKLLDNLEYSVSIRKRKRRINDKLQNRTFKVVADLSSNSITLEE